MEPRHSPVYMGFIRLFFGGGKGLVSSIGLYFDSMDGDGVEMGA